MQRKMLLGKIHRATVTEADLHYKGSITIDSELMEGSGIIEYEHVDVWNITTGDRFATYAITGEPGSGTICINGAAAHKAKVGDMIIIAHFGWLSEAEIRRHSPQVVMVDEENRAVNYDEPNATDLHALDMAI